MAEIMDTNKLVWAYLLEHGGLTTDKWSYYGSHYEYEGNKYPSYKELEDKKKRLLEKVKSIGIDWDKTNTPTSEENNCFDGTFVESSNTECLLGTLVLKDNSKYFLTMSGVEKRFSEYSKSVMAFNKDQQRAREILGEDS